LEFFNFLKSNFYSMQKERFSIPYDLRTIKFQVIRT